MSFQLQNSEVLARLKPFGILFEKSLSDLIKGIRSHLKESPESLLKFLDSAISECKDELTTTDLETKAMAVLKLAYLEMYGFDMSWCNFQILEVMSSTNFQQKRIGYLAAIQSFKNEQDLLILATNQFKKDLNSSNHVDVGLALSGIATIVTPNLSKDINDDVLMKLNHSSPYIRKKAVLAMYKIFLQYPDSLRINFNRIIEKLDDSDVAVVSATINVICEISKKNPRIFVNYLPKFFVILEQNENNWLIIRILKLFQSLSKVEPRMKKKILPIILNMMLATDASSLRYECINCIVNGGMLSSDSSKDKDVAKQCIEYLINFFCTTDSNLKFVGLLALINILKLFPTLMHKVPGVSNIVRNCLVDPDLIIKQKALEVCHFLVTEENVVEIVKVLLTQLIPNENPIPESLKLEISAAILQITSKDNFKNVPNFDWYIAVLKDLINLTLLPLPSSANSVVSSKTSLVIAVKIGDELKSLASKVPSIRPALLKKIVVNLLLDVKVVENCPLLLKDLYWIMGEYIDDFVPLEDSDSDDDISEVEEKVVYLGKKVHLFNTLVNGYVDSELGLSSNVNFPISKKLVVLPHPDVLVVLLQALVKLLNGIVHDYISLYSLSDGKMDHHKVDELRFFLHKLIKFFNNWENHEHYEVQERTLSWSEFLKLSLEALGQGSSIQKMEAEEIKYYENIKTTPEESEGEESENESEEGEGSDGSEESDSENEYQNLSSNEENEELSDKESEKSENEAHAVEKSDPSIHEPEEEFSEEIPFLLTHILSSFFKVYPLNPISQNSQKRIPLPEDLDLDTVINELPELSNLSEDEDSDEESLFSPEEDTVTKLGEMTLSASDEDLRKQERLDRMKDDPYYLTSSSDNKKSKKAKRALIETVNNEAEDEKVESKSTTKTKTKKGKKKKSNIVILTEETIGGPDQEETKEIEVKKPKKKNTIKIDSSNLDNFDLNSMTASEVATLEKDFEYNVDLQALRDRLASQSKESETKEKKKKSDKPKKHKSKLKEMKDETKNGETKEDQLKNGDTKEISKDKNLIELDSKQEPDVVIQVKPKKKSKKKAKILD